MFCNVFFLPGLGWKVGALFASSEFPQTITTKTPLTRPGVISVSLSTYKDVIVLLKYIYNTFIIWLTITFITSYSGKCIRKALWTLIIIYNNFNKNALHIVLITHYYIIITSSYKHIPVHVMNVFYGSLAFIESDYNIYCQNSTYCLLWWHKNS